MHGFTSFMYFSSKKSSKNPLKMKPERLKNRCPKRINFWNRYFHVLVSILEGLGPPSWSQVGQLGLPGPSPKPPKSSFLRTCVQDAAQEAPKGIPRRAESLIFNGFFVDFAALSRHFWLRRFIFSIKTAGASVTWKVHMYFLSDAIARKAYRLQATCLG